MIINVLRGNPRNKQPFPLFTSEHRVFDNGQAGRDHLNILEALGFGIYIPKRQIDSQGI